MLRNKNEDAGRQKRKHKRGSTARHTLGVDVAWLKKLVINRHFSANQNDQKVISHASGSTDAVDDLVSPTELASTPSESQNL